MKLHQSTSHKFFQYSPFNIEDLIQATSDPMDIMMDYEDMTENWNLNRGNDYYDELEEIGPVTPVNPLGNYKHRRAIKDNLAVA